jgi:hypothetical protein
VSAAVSPRAAARLRVTALFLGACILLWLPFEDTRITWPLGFGIAITAWCAVFLVNRYLASITAKHPQVRPLALLARFSLVGLLAGLAVSPLTLFLMVFKTGLHGHGFPDFTFDQLLSVLRRTPVFGLSGLLLSLGIGIILLYATNKHANRL